MSQAGGRASVATGSVDPDKAGYGTERDEFALLIGFAITASQRIPGRLKAVALANEKWAVVFITDGFVGVVARIAGLNGTNSRIFGGRCASVFGRRCASVFGRRCASVFGGRCAHVCWRNP